MVKEGWAIAYRYFSKDYVNEEEIAKIKRKGSGRVVLLNLIFGGKIINLQFRVLMMTIRALSLPLISAP